MVRHEAMREGLDVLRMALVGCDVVNVNEMRLNCQNPCLHSFRV